MFRHNPPGSWSILIAKQVARRPANCICSLSIRRVCYPTVSLSPMEKAVQELSLVVFAARPPHSSPGAMRWYVSGHDTSNLGHACLHPRSPEVGHSHVPFSCVRCALVAGVSVGARGVGIADLSPVQPLLEISELTPRTTIPYAMHGGGEKTPLNSHCHAFH